LKAYLVKKYIDRADSYRKYPFVTQLRAFIIRDLLGDISNSRIVDIGCGDGNISLQYIPLSNHITLIDLSEKMLDVAKQNMPKQFHENVTYINMDFLEYEPAQLFDIVICLGVLAHVSLVSEAMEKISKLLRPGGRCIIQFTDLDQPFSKFLYLYFLVHKFFADPYHYSINHITFREIAQLTNQCHLRLERKLRYSLLLPGMGKLPDQFLYKYELFTFQHRLLSRLGSEMILLLTKE
jgi:2-polyprenyl-3-methyl-5-hydroxy-6-metoxy-1,4-benzoquinol methylase